MIQDIINKLQANLYHNYDITILNENKFEIIFFDFNNIDQIRTTIDILNYYDNASITYCTTIPKSSGAAYDIILYDNTFLEKIKQHTFYIYLKMIIIL